MIWRGISDPSRIKALIDKLAEANSGRLQTVIEERESLFSEDPRAMSPIDSTSFFLGAAPDPGEIPISISPAPGSRRISLTEMSLPKNSPPVANSAILVHTTGRARAFSSHVASSGLDESANAEKSCDRSHEEVLPLTLTMVEP